ncbi:hypothetical protein PVAP13_1KG451905 [Panicum virgatum]|uniref:Uncharacterized protein n=1 Tax=Panicum virgatum TaxID=38727 RepID=A0A8T0XGI3_PANVG|nr:hypothetical protein PVAP13_1KG451905 [Panicum virgatum]
MAMSDARYKLLGGGQYPSECDEDAPVPPALPVLFCRCEPGNQLAIVKQSRHPKTAGRAFYICKRWVPPPPNPPPMTEEEKQEVAIYHVNNPSKCHCGVRAKLHRHNIGVPPKFTSFFKCSLKTKVSVM